MTDVIFSKSFDETVVLEHEFLKWANFANFNEFICFIRRFVPFALKISDFEKALVGEGTTVYIRTQACFATN